MADDIIQFSPGEKVTAEETNENNLLLKEWALDNSASEAYIDGKIATLTSNLNGQISSINTQISNKANIASPTFTGTVRVPNSATVGTAVSTAAISKTATTNTSGYVKFGNGIIIQWLKFTQSSTAVTHTWKIAFTSGTSYVTVLSQISNGQDENIAVTAQTASNFTCDAESAERANGLYAIAIGY